MALHKCIFDILCGRPTRPHYGSSPSVCLYVRLSQSKTKRCRKKKQIWLNVPRDVSNWCANFQLKGQRSGQRSKVRVSVMVMVRVRSGSGLPLRSSRQTAAQYVGTGSMYFQACELIKIVNYRRACMTALK